jgi:hypothetical protein
VTPGPLAARAEVVRLGRLLELEPPVLAALEQLPAADLRRLRAQVVDARFDADEHDYERLTRAVGLLPGALVATIAQKAFGPMLCAHVAGRLQPKQAVDLAARLPTAFLAELCTELDPRRAGPIVSGIPTARIVAIAAHLLATGEHVTAAGFVEHLDDATLDAVIAASADGDLLRIAFVIEDVDALDGLVARIGEDRLRGILRVALHDDLWTEGLALLDALSDAGRTRVVPLLEDELRAAEPDIRARALARAEELGVADELLAVLDGRS